MICNVPRVNAMCFDDSRRGPAIGSSERVEYKNGLPSLALSRACIPLQARRVVSLTDEMAVASSRDLIEKNCRKVSSIRVYSFRVRKEKVYERKMDLKKERFGIISRHGLLNEGRFATAHETRSRTFALQRYGRCSDKMSKEEIVTPADSPSPHSRSRPTITSSNIYNTFNIPLNTID